jgi:nucleoid-associated protein YgaU
MSDQEKLQQLEQKYQSVLNSIPQLGIRLQNQHLQDGKLFLRGEAPSEEAKNKIWDQIKLVDPNYSDLTADIRVSEQAQPSTQTAGAAASGGQQHRSYTVQSGDSLSKIAKQFYGNSSQYMKIFEANRNQLSDPDKIRPGQQLVIPE